MLAHLKWLLGSPIPQAIIPNIITAIGLTNSVITFVLTNILQRRSMVRWRQLAWITFAFLWSAIVACLVDLIVPSYGATMKNLGTKCGITLWALGLICLVFLVHKIFSISLSSRTASITSLMRRVDPFLMDTNYNFGVPFLDAIRRRVTSAGEKIFFPIVLVSDRSGVGLQISHRFLTQGMIDGEGTVYVSFTRPWTIVAHQILSHLPQTPRALERQMVILDCYGMLYLADERRNIGPAVDHKIEVRFCDPRDPVEIKTGIRNALRYLQRSGVKSVRLLYDSLSDYLAVADEELVVSYLRSSIVWEELYGVKSIYLVWPDMLRTPMSEEYLAWFGNTVLWVKDKVSCYSAVLEGVGGKPINMMFNSKLEMIIESDFSVDEDRVAHMANIIARLGYRPDDYDGLTPFSHDAYREAQFIFFLTAIDHNTHGERKYTATIGGKLVHGSDLLYEQARSAAAKEKDLFTPERVRVLSADDLRRILRVGQDLEPVGIEERAELLNDAADILLRFYSGDIRKLFAKADGCLRRPDNQGALDLLRVFKAYMDPLEKKSFLLVKLLRRRKLIEIKDTQNIDVPVDHVLFTIALRSGLVRMDQSLKEAILSGISLDKETVEKLRRATLLAFRRVAAVSGVAVDVFDDLLWAYGREVLGNATPLPMEKAELIRIGLNEQIENKAALIDFIQAIAGIDSELTAELSKLPVPVFPPTSYF